MIRHLYLPVCLVVAICGSVVSGADSTTATLRPPAQLLCEYRTNPLGIDVKRPRLSWQLRDDRRGAVQTAYQLLVASEAEALAGGKADVWDSGRVESDHSIHVPYGGPALESGRRYYWTVRTWDAGGTVSPWAEPAWWEMGLLHFTDWSAQWVTPPYTPAPATSPATTKPVIGELPSVHLRKEIALNGPPVRARAYVSGLGAYVMNVNGRRIGEDVFSPEWTQYTRRIQYQTYDVTKELTAGVNAIGATLGNGWWGCKLGWKGGSSYATGNPRFLLQLEVDYADGSRDRFVTDETWKWHHSPITFDSLYHGEHYDATHELPGWDRAGFDDAKWGGVEITRDHAAAKIVAQMAEPIRVTEELAAQKITQPSPGVYVYDFGQNAAGWVTLKIKAPRGTKITLRFAEILNDDGTPYYDNYRSARATDEYVCRGDGEETWQPLFTYRGFRYAVLTGCPGEPPKDALTMRVAHSSGPFAGTFTCSNELLNRLQQNIRWGQRSNLYSVPTDCPQRDERLGWMGDAQTFAPTACWNMNLASFFTKWMRDIADSQFPSGATTNVSPVIVSDREGAPGWADAAVVIPWTVYCFYGDTRIIEENFDTMKRFVEYMRKQSPNGLYERKGYGDWIAVVPSPSEPIGSAYYCYSTKLLAKMAAVIGHEAEAAEYAALAKRIADAFNAEYLGRITNNYVSRTQTANALPLWFGITPADRREAVAKNIADDVRTRKFHLSTGFLGTAYLLPVLSQYGYHETAYRIATQTSYPSWGYMIEKGATTIWELWDSDKQGPKMNSRNHFALGACGQWFYEELGGIHPDPDKPGFKHMVISPRPAGDLKNVRCEYPSMYGVIRAEWVREANSLTLTVVIPPNTSAQVILPVPPDASVTVREGDNVLVRDNQPEGVSEGVKFVKLEPRKAVLAAAAGTYRFVATWK